MAYSVEKLLQDAAALVGRLKEQDAVADILISQTGNLHKRMEAMKEYQDDITELNEIAKHRPRSHLVIGIAQENRQIRELQQENRELRLFLEEHQSATELIMKKYRQQVNSLVETNKWEKALAQAPDTQDREQLISKICEMANVMHKAVTVDEDASAQNKERLTQLEIENRGLRELLEICSTSTMKIIDKNDSPRSTNNSANNDSPRSTASNDDKATENALPNEKQEIEDDEKSGEQTPRNEEPET